MGSWPSCLTRQLDTLILEAWHWTPFSLSWDFLITECDWLENQCFETLSSSGLSGQWGEANQRGGLCYRMLCAPPHSYTGVLTPSFFECDYIWDGVLWRWLNENWSFNVGSNPVWLAVSAAPPPPPPTPFLRVLPTCLMWGKMGLDDPAGKTQQH